MSITALRTGHIGINVTDVDRSTAFYGPLFGLDVVTKGTEEGRRFVFLGREGKLVLTLWQQARDGFDGGRAGLHHLSFEVDTMEEVRAAEDLLRELGADFAYEGVVPHGEGAASGGIFFTDPDGTRLEIYAPTGAEHAAAPVAAAPTCGFF